jgi:hypothetical protein
VNNRRSRSLTTAWFLGLACPHDASSGSLANGVTERVSRGRQRPTASGAAWALTAPSDRPVAKTLSISQNVKQGFDFLLTNSVELSTTREATRYAAFYGSQRFITAFTRALHLYLS